MTVKGKNLGVRAYLVGKLRELGLSRRDSVRILNCILEEMSKALKRGRAVEFPFGKLVRVKRHYGKWWEALDDVPAGRQRYTVKWELDTAGWKLLEGRRAPKERPGWSQKSGK